MTTSAFISYAWETVEHRDWILQFASRLRGDGIEARIDVWHLLPGDDLPRFMEESILGCDFVLLICTPEYRTRAETRRGGVGYEGTMITAELFTLQPKRKFIPVLRRGEWPQAAPIWLQGKLYVDLRGNPYREEQYHLLLRALYRIPSDAPPLGSALNGLSEAREEKSPGGREYSMEAEKPKIEAQQPTVNRLSEKEKTKSARQVYSLSEVARLSSNGKVLLFTFASEEGSGENSSRRDLEKDVFPAIWQQAGDVSICYSRSKGLLSPTAIGSELRGMGVGAVGVYLFVGGRMVAHRNLSFFASMIPDMYLREAQELLRAAR